MQAGVPALGCNFEFLRSLYEDYNNTFTFYSDLSQKLPLKVNPHTMDSAHTKTHLLLQAHFCQAQLPSSDYLTDTKSVLDQAIRILQVRITKLI